MLARYAAIVKNLRGVLIFTDADEAEERVRWLTERFKYRNLGVSPALSSQIEVERPFVELTYPDDELERLTRLLMDAGLSEVAAEASVLASAHISPLLALDRRAVRLLRPLEAGSVETSKKLNNREWKLHLRIADYTVLDFYIWSIENAERLWTEEDPKRIIGERLGRIGKDSKRYWRIIGEGKKFLIYLDPVRLLWKRNLLEPLRKLQPSKVSAGLAIGAAVCILPELFSSQADPQR